MKLRHVFVLLSSALLVAADAKDDAVKKELKQLQGEWHILSFENAGTKASEEQLRAVKAVIDKDGKMTVIRDGEKFVEAKMTFDPSKDPKTFDAEYTEGDLKGQKVKGIYELKDDKLRTCRSMPGKDRPTKFEAGADSGNIMIVYQRIKK